MAGKPYVSVFVFVLACLAAWGIIVVAVPGVDLTSSVAFWVLLGGMAFYMMIRQRAAGAGRAFPG